MIQKLWTRILSYKLDLEALGVAFVSIVTVVILFKSCSHPAPVITTVAPNNTTVTTQGTTVPPKEVIKYVEDTANVEKLLAENKNLKIQVTQLTETIAQTTSTGSGPIVVVPSWQSDYTTHIPEPSVLATPPNPNPPIQNIDFKDWRLHFWTQGLQGSYQLTQKFEVINTSGKNKDGVVTNIVQLFEIAPDGSRLPVPTVKTTSVVAVDSGKHWFLSPTLQAGYGLVYANSVRSQGAIVGLQLLKRGTTRTAEDSSFSLLTPAVFLTDTIHEPGILPISINVGRLKYQPFKDLWASPFIGYNVSSRTLGKIGVALTASF